MAQRKKDAGMRKVCAWITHEAADALKAMAVDRGRTQEQTIEELIREAWQDPKE